MMAGTVEVMGVLAIVVALSLLLAIVDAPPRNPARYSGRIFDPQRPVLRRAGAVDIGGRVCPLCQATTFGWSTRCGKCGRLNVQPRAVRTESTRAKLLVPLTTPSPASEAGTSLASVPIQPFMKPCDDTGDGATQ